VNNINKVHNTSNNNTKNINNNVNKNVNNNVNKNVNNVNKDVLLSNSNNKVVNIDNINNIGDIYKNNDDRFGFPVIFAHI